MAKGKFGTLIAFPPQGLFSPVMTLVTVGRDPEFPAGRNFPG
jgi:hypothetical protein